MDTAAVRAWCEEHGVDRDVALALINRELAKRRLVEFGYAVYPGFQAPKHIQYLSGLLERAERGEIRRIAISAPPGHGKSTLLQNFLAWFLGRDPRRRILALSASEMLARRNSRTVRGMVQSENWPWPDVKLVGESLEEWQTAQGGGVRAIGQTGTVTGFRAEMVLCDDVQPDAGTETSRATLEAWFREVLSTRLEPNGIAVVIQTRWHDADLIGQLQVGESADQWMFVNIPAIATDSDDVLGREVGEALWPERWPVELLEAKKAEITAAGFGAQYQGDPVPAGGAMFTPEWFGATPQTQGRNRYDAIPLVRKKLNSEERPAPVIRIQAIDCAAKTGVRNDRTAVSTLVSDLRDIYIEHVWVDRVGFTDLKRKVLELYGEFRPSRVYVEEASNGYALLDELRAEIPLIGVKPGTDSKEARAEATTATFEQGLVKFPRYASWVQDALNEFLRFPNGRHDDIVDSIVLGISQMQVAIARVLSDERHSRQVQNLRGWMAR